MSNRGVTILTGSALAAGLLAGVLIGRASANDGGEPSTREAPQAAAGGVDPKSYPRTKEGAATAAQAYDETLRRAVLMPVDERRPVVEAISSSAMREQIAKDVEQGAEVGAKVFDLPKDRGQVVLRVAPLGYRVVSFTSDSARVETWTVTVFGKPGVGRGIPPQFGTTTIDLAWTKGWRLAGTPQSKAGPTPAADNPEAAAAVAAAAKDLQEFTHVAR